MEATRRRTTASASRCIDVSAAATAQLDPTTVDMNITTHTGDELEICDNAAGGSRAQDWSIMVWQASRPNDLLMKVLDVLRLVAENGCLTRPSSATDLLYIYVSISTSARSFEFESNNNKVDVLHVRLTDLHTAHQNLPFPFPVDWWVYVSTACTPCAQLF